MFLDIALSVVAGNRLDIYRRRGEPIPAGWALDKDGEPTTDPGEANDGGTYAPLADYKGSGMAIVLVGDHLVSGRRRLRRSAAARPAGTNHWFAAYDIATVRGPRPVCVRGARRARAGPAQSAPARVRPGVRTGRPGERKRATPLREGIPFEQFTLDELEWVAEHTGVPLLRRANGTG